MATSTCLKCLPRQGSSMTLSKSSLLRIGSLGGVGQFSTSARSLATPPKKKTGTGMPVRVRAKGDRNTPVIKKKPPPTKSGKPPASGERKAARKRVVLSNNNAFEVVGMRDLDKAFLDEICRDEVEIGKEAEDGSTEGKEGKELILEGQEEEEVGGNRWVGKVVGLTAEAVDGLRAVEGFKAGQHWSLFRRPGVLIRAESVFLSKGLLRAEKEKTTARLVIDGKRGTGKSLMMLHGMATAFVRDWLVINIPEAQDVTNAMNDYAPIPSTNPLQWQQMTYTANWLTQIAKANNAILSKMTLKKPHNIPGAVTIDADISMTRLLELGARDPEFAWAFFKVFWDEIMQPDRPPVMLCLDSMNFIMQDSLYRDTENKPIHAQDLAIIRHFADYLSGNQELTNGGAIIAAPNYSHAPISVSTELMLQQAYERQYGEDAVTERDPWEKNYDLRAEEALKNVEVLRLEGLSKVEARGLMEYWAKSGVLRERVDEKAVTGRWALAGGGVVGELKRGALFMRI